MKGVFEVRVTGTGTWGPFAPDTKELATFQEENGRAATPADVVALSRSYSYAEIAATDGSGSRKATFAEGFDWNPELFVTVYSVVLDVKDTGKVKLVGLATETSARKAA